MGPKLALLVSVALWSTAFVGIRWGISSYSPGSLSLLRFLVASVCLIPPLFASRPRLPKAKEWGGIAMVGLIGIAAYSVLLNTGEKTVPAGIASFIVSQTPVITAVLAVLFLRERIDRITILGIAISAGGVTLIVLGEGLQIDFSLGLLIIALAAICGSMHSVFQKPLLNTMPLAQVIAYATWAGTLALMVFAPTLLDEIGNASFESTAAAVYLGIVPAAMAQWCWAYGLKHTSVINATLYLYTMPILTTLFGWLFLGEAPTLYALVGGVIALFGAALVQRDFLLAQAKVAPAPALHHSPAPKHDDVIGMAN